MCPARRRICSRDTATVIRLSSICARNRRTSIAPSPPKSPVSPTTSRTNTNWPRRARHAVEKTLREMTGQTDLDAAKAITLRELERTAAVNKSLFEDFLQRARVTQEQSTFEVRDARVISPAQPPALPSSPKTGQTMMISALLGLLAGVGGAYLLEMLNAGFTTPRQVEDMLEHAVAGLDLEI